MTPLRTMAPMGLNRRVSPESAWPLRTAGGRFDEIAEYNRKDVEAVREVFRKFEVVGLV